MAKINLLYKYADKTVGSLNKQLLEMARNKTVNYDICHVDDIIKKRLDVEECAEKELVGFEFNRSIHKQFQERYAVLRKHKEQYLIDIGKINSQLEEENYKQQQDMRQVFKDANTTQYLIGKIEQLKHLTLIYESYKDSVEKVVEMLAPLNDYMTSASTALAISNPMNLIRRYTALQDIFKENVASRHAVIFKVDHLKAKLRSRTEFHDAQLLRLYETINKLVVEHFRIALKNRDDEAALETRLQSSSVEETMRFNTNNAIRNIYEKITSHSIGSKYTRTDDPFDQVKIIHNGFQSLMDVADIVYKKELAAVKKATAVGSAKASKTATELQKEFEKKYSMDLQEKSFSIAQPQPPRPPPKKVLPKRGRGKSVRPPIRRKGMVLPTADKSLSNVDIPKIEKTAPKHYPVHKRHTLPPNIADIARIILPISRSSTRPTSESIPATGPIIQPTDDSCLPKVDKSHGKKRFLTATRKVKCQVKCDINKPETQCQEYSDLLEKKDDKSPVGKITFQNRKDSEGSQNQQKAETSETKQSNVDRRKTIVDKRLTIVDKRQTIVDKRQTNVDRRKTNVDRRQTNFDKREFDSDSRPTVDRRKTNVDRRQTIFDKREFDSDSRPDNVDRRKTNVNKLSN